MLVTRDQSSNPGRDCISHVANALEMGINPIILPPAMDRILDQTGLLTLEN